MFLKDFGSYLNNGIINDVIIAWICKLHIHDANFVDFCLVFKLLCTSAQTPIFKRSPDFSWFSVATLKNNNCQQT